LLTGLANHRRRFGVLQAEISRTKRTQREFSFLLLDLNEASHHANGDGRGNQGAQKRWVERPVSRN